MSGSPLEYRTLDQPAELDDERLHLAGLASLGATPFQVAKLLEGFSPSEAWRAVSAGRHPADPKAKVQAKATSELLARTASLCAQMGVRVSMPGDSHYPSDLLDDPQRPPVLFSLGDPLCLEHRPRVAIVGTRAATAYGTGVAVELGCDLARSGVAVVSGLARGIDAAAHLGVLRAGSGASPVAVLGCAHDTRGPQVDGDLRSAVADSGVVFSELAPGAAPARWSFALRNRVMAALSHVVVVVECHYKGGSLYTVEAARDRGIPVMAVPGSVRSRASQGTNEILAVDGLVARDANDILSCVEQEIAGRADIRPPRIRSMEKSGALELFPAVGKRPGGAQSGGVQGSGLPGGWVRDMSARGRAVFGAHGVETAPVAGGTNEEAEIKKVAEVLTSDPMTLDEIVNRTGLSFGQVSVALYDLVDEGSAREEGGWWSSTS